MEHDSDRLVQPPRLRTTESLPTPKPEAYRFPLKGRVSLSELVSSSADLTTQRELAAASGVRGLGLLRRTLWRDGEDLVGEWLRDHGLRAETLSWAGGFTGTLGFSYREAISDCRAALAEASVCGAATVIIAGGGRGTHTVRHARRLVVEGLKSVAQDAEQRGVQLALVVKPPRPSQRWSIFESWDHACDVIDAVGSASVGLATMLDSWTMSLPGCWKSVASRLQVLQIPLSDPPGTEAPLPGLLAWQQLRMAGFRGTVSLEPGWLGTAEAAEVYQPARCRTYIAAWCELLGLSHPRRTGRRRPDW